MRCFEGWTATTLFFNLEALLNVQKKTWKVIALTFENMGIPFQPYSKHITVGFTQIKDKFQNFSVKPVTKQTKDTRRSSN